MEEIEEEKVNEILPESEEEEQIPERRDYEKELIQIIHDAKTAEELKNRLDDYHENDIAAALEQLDETDSKKLLAALGNEEAADVFAYLDDMNDYIDVIGTEKAADIIEEMDADDAREILEEMDEEHRAEVVSFIDEETKKDIELISSYEEDEIGSRMTTNYVVIDRGSTIKQAMNSLVKQAEDNDNISTIYVQQEDGTFFGAISLNELIIARANRNLEDIVTTSYPYVYAKESISEVIEELKDYSEDSIPVLDNSKKIIGVITSQDIVEIVDDEMGDDYAKLAGLVAEEELEEPLLQSMRKRLPWLGILMVLGLVVSSVISVFEGVIQSLSLIVCFQSVVLDMSGNVGTQSLAVTIRVLTDENLTGAQKFKLALKELRVGFCNGLLLGSLTFGFIGLFICIFMHREPGLSFAVSACIGLALLMAMMISSLVGTLIPLFFHKIHVDPAVASGPLITTVNDLVAVVSYYGLAWIMLLNVMHLSEM